MVPTTCSAVAGVTCCRATQRAFSSASAGLSPTTMAVPGKILTSSSGRPAATARARMSAAKASASASTEPCREKITSADRAAKSRPCGESPAWKITGCPCGPRVPDPPGRREHLRGAVVPAGVVQVAAAAEVLAGPGVVGGDDVPGRAPAGQHVQAREPPGQVDRVVVRGVLGRDQADPLGHGGQRGELGDRVRAADDVEVVQPAAALPEPEALAE